VEDVETLSRIIGVRSVPLFRSATRPVLAVMGSVDRAGFRSGGLEFEVGSTSQCGAVTSKLNGCPGKKCRSTGLALQATVTSATIAV